MAKKRRKKSFPSKKSGEPSRVGIIGLISLGIVIILLIGIGFYENGFVGKAYHHYFKPRIAPKPAAQPHLPLSSKPSPSSEPIVTGWVFLRQWAHPYQLAIGTDISNIFLSDLFFEIASNQPLSSFAVIYHPRETARSIPLTPCKQPITSCQSSDQKWLITPITEAGKTKWKITVNEMDENGEEIWKDENYSFAAADHLQITCNHDFTECKGQIPASLNYYVIGDSPEKTLNSSYALDSSSLGYTPYEHLGPICPYKSDKCESVSFDFYINLKKPTSSTKPALSTKNKITLSPENNFFQKINNLFKRDISTNTPTFFKEFNNGYYQNQPGYLYADGYGCYCQQSNPPKPLSYYVSETPFPSSPEATPSSTSKTTIPKKEMPSTTISSPASPSLPAPSPCLNINKGQYTIKDNGDGTFTLILKENN